MSSQINDDVSNPIVFVDIPDPDNLLMILRVLRDFPNERVPVVLSPRPVDLSIRRYGNSFGDIRKKLEDMHMKVNNLLEPSSDLTKIINQQLLFPVTSDTKGLEGLDDETKNEWFQPDAGFKDSRVVEDTKLYMDLSEIRFAALLESEGVSPDRYTFYRDLEHLAGSTIRAGLRHSAHVHDFTYGFNDAELAVYEEATQATQATRDHPSRGDLYREKLRELCRSYIARMSNGETKSHPTLQDLISHNRDNGIVPYFIVGGPFTEVSKYIKQSDHDGKVKVKGILAMGGYIHGDNNLFPNQFNFHVDLQSAKEVLQMVQEKNIPLRLLPTECVKNSPFELSDNDLVDIFPSPKAPTAGLESRASENEVSALETGPVPAVRKFCTTYMKDTRVKKCTPFDLITAVIVKTPNLLPLRWVTPVLEQKLVGDACNEDVIITFREDANGKIKMFWNNEEYMEDKRPLLLKILKADLHATESVSTDI